MYLSIDEAVVAMDMYQNLNLRLVWYGRLHGSYIVCMGSFLDTCVYKTLHLRTLYQHVYSRYACIRYVPTTSRSTHAIIQVNLYVYITSNNSDLII